MASVQRIRGGLGRSVTRCPYSPLPASFPPFPFSPACSPSSPSLHRLQQQRHHHNQRHHRRRPHPLRPVLEARFQWRPIPVGLGIACLCLLQAYKVSTRDGSNSSDDGIDATPAGRPHKRPRARPEGPWQVRVMSTLPLKAISRLWGRFNELTIPYYLRVPGFRLYSAIFGVNLDEVAEPDLHAYPNLAAFFYRTLKPGARPLDPNPNALLSPADGRVLQFGRIEGSDIEQVKGMTYSIDALLGKHTPTPSIAGDADSARPEGDKAQPGPVGDEEIVRQDEEFARLNDISYTLPGLLSGSGRGGKAPAAPVADESTEPSPASVSQVRTDLALGERPWYSLLSPDSKTALFYAVIYLAPGDYHRYHSPANWVVERRRHFAGELYSVSPYLQRTLPGLFTLNERVVLLGRWRWGFFSFVPVGATNVGSIVVNFDHELRTNSLTTDTAADRAAEEAAGRGEPYQGFAEATYAAASRVLGGHALRRGEEMGGFKLGSTIVLVFEAPADGGAEGAGAGAAMGEGASRWKWAVEKGQKVKVGQTLGKIEE